MVPYADFMDLQRRYDLLVNHVVTMKREGFAPQTTDDPVTPVPDLPVAIRKAINALGVDTATVRRLQAQAWDDLASGVTDEEIAQRIARGEPADL